MSEPRQPTRAAEFFRDLCPTRAYCELSDARITELALKHSQGSDWQSSPACWAALHSFARAVESEIRASCAASNA